MSQSPRTVRLATAYNRALTVRDHAPNVIVVLMLIMLREIAAITDINFPGSSHYVVLALVFCAHHVYTLDRTDHKLFEVVGHELSGRIQTDDQ